MGYFVARRSFGRTGPITQVIVATGFVGAAMRCSPASSRSACPWSSSCRDTTRIPLTSGEPEAYSPRPWPRSRRLPSGNDEQAFRGVLSHHSSLPPMCGTSTSVSTRCTRGGTGSSPTRCAAPGLGGAQSVVGRITSAIAGGGYRCVRLGTELFTPDVHVSHASQHVVRGYGRLPWNYRPDAFTGQVRISMSERRSAPWAVMIRPAEDQGITAGSTCHVTSTTSRWRLSNALGVRRSRNAGHLSVHNLGGLRVTRLSA